MRHHSQQQGRRSEGTRAFAAFSLSLSKADKIKNLQVKLFQKPGNKFLFLPHMFPHIIKGWIGGYIKRMRLNFSLEQEFHTALTKFKTHLKARGYNNCILNGLFSVLPNRQVLLTAVSKTTSNGVPFITTYTAEVAYNKAELLQALTAPQGLEIHPDIEFILAGRKRPLLALKREKNLREMLVKAQLSSTEVL